MYKCFTDLRRCSLRLDDYIASGEDTDNEELLLEMLETMKNLMDKIPQQYR